MKSCLFCSHCSWEKIQYHYYSTLTGGDQFGGLHCSKLHFTTYRCQDVEDLTGFRELVEKAEGCVDYAPAGGAA